MNALAFKTVVFFFIVLLCRELFPQELPPTLSLRGQYTLVDFKEIIKGSDSQGPYFLSRFFIYPQSERVSDNTGAVLTCAEDYSMDYENGTILFRRKIASGDVYTIEYRAFPFPVKSEYSLRSPEQAEKEKASEETQPAARTPKMVTRDPFAGSDINISGSKSVGIEVGTGKDLSIDQALRVNVSGKVSEDVGVRAILSDQNLPIQPEGTTEKLQELDKVLVEVTSPHFNVTLGDYVLSSSGAGGSFARFDRKLEGAMAELIYSPQKIRAAGAISRGKVNTQEFQGVEGKQGPYILSGKQGERNIVVLSGSEKVWIDGKRMTRGENNDYIIDYSSGEIFFTVRNLITSENIIVADFEYSDERFKRELFSGDANAEFVKGFLKLTPLFIIESDDSSNPVRGEFTAQELEIIRNAGTDPSLAYKDGAVKVDSLGDYDLEPTGQGEYAYVYNPGKGEYRVTFTVPPRQSGDYVKSVDSEGRIYYRYAGTGLGTHLPRVYLPLPESHKLGSLAVQVNQKGQLRLNSEFAASSSDKNTLSSLEGDSLKWGSALKTELQFIPQEFELFKRIPNKLMLKTSYANIGKGFVPMGRVISPLENREWDNENAFTLKGMEDFGIEGELNSTSLYNFRASFESRHLSDNETRIKQTGNFGISPPGLPVFNVFYNSAMTKSHAQSFFREIILSLNHSFWLLKPGIQFENQINKNKKQEFPDKKFNDYRILLETKTFYQTKLNTELRYRKDEAALKSGGDYQDLST